MNSFIAVHTSNSSVWINGIVAVINVVFFVFFFSSFSLLFFFSYFLSLSISCSRSFSHHSSSSPARGVFAMVRKWYRISVLCLSLVDIKIKHIKTLATFSKATWARSLIPKRISSWCLCVWRKLISDYSQMESIYISETVEMSVHAFSSILWAKYFLVSFTSIVGRIKEQHVWRRSRKSCSKVDNTKKRMREIVCACKSSTQSAIHKQVSAS